MKHVGLTIHDCHVMISCLTRTLEDLLRQKALQASQAHKVLGHLHQHLVT